MTAHEMVLKLDDEAMNLGADVVNASKSKSKHHLAEETAIRSFWVLYYLAHGMLCELAKKEEQNVEA